MIRHAFVTDASHARGYRFRKGPALPPEGGCAGVGS
jgi:hypothetical protein